MRDWWRWALLAVFGASIAWLGYYVFCAADGGRGTLGPERPGRGYRQVAQVELGGVEVRDYRRMGFTRGIVRFSPEGARLAVGTENGRVLVLSAAGEVLWQRPAGIGKVTALEFSADGAFLFVGETSAEGNVYCLESATGAERWRRGTAGEVGVDVKRRNHPGIVRILSDRSGRVFVLAQRHDRPAGGESLYYARVLCFGADGREVWRFPAGEPMDAWVNWLSADEGGGRLVFGTANFDTDRRYRFAANVYCLDGATGAESWSAAVDPTPPFGRTVMRGSPNISADGRLVAAMASDGRALLFDAAGRELWRRTLSEPKLIGGAHLNAVGRDAYVVGDYAVFATINTYNSANWQLPTPVEHPGSNSVFVFAVDGSFASRWRAGGSIEEVASSAGRRLAVAVGRNTKTKDHRVHGVYVIGLPAGTEEARLPTDGPCVAVAISADERLAAGIEAPLLLDDGTVTGGYRLWLWARGE